MRTPQAEPTVVSKPSKEKKQLMVLGVLGIVLVVVLSAQFSGAEGEDAQAAGPADASAGAPSEPAAETPASLTSSVPDNAVLASAAADPGIKSSPFESFWNTGVPAETATPIEELPPPSVTLNGTLTSARRPVAVVDGQTRYIGDMISGWRLVNIGSRRINLESPTKSLVTIEMPLLRSASKRRP